MSNETKVSSHYSALVLMRKPCIAASSPVSWQHINLHGEFDFSDDALKDSLRFDIEALPAFNWEHTPNPPV